MRINLIKKSMQITVSPYVTVKFDGKELRTIFNNAVMDTRPAKVGDMFWIYPQGSKKPPKIEQAKMPDKRGEKISWALSFKNELSRTSSLEDFCKQTNPLPTTGKGSVTVQRSSYAFMMTEKENGKLSPALSWVSDDISKAEIKELIKDYTLFGKLFCPEEFILVL